MKIGVVRGVPGIGTLFLALLLGIGAAGCGGGGGVGDVTLIVGTRSDAQIVSARSNDVEGAILSQIYAQALEDAGYAVETKPDPVDTSAATEALKQGRISGYPDHLDVTLAWLSGQPEVEGPSDAQAAYEQAKKKLEKEGLTAFPPAPFSLSNAVVMLEKTARRRGMETTSDLEGQSEDLTISGGFGCHGGWNCAGGLERSYGLTFDGFLDAFSTDAQLFAALEANQVDVAMLPATEGRLAAENGKFVTLADDENRFPAGNVIFVTTLKVVEEAGAAYEETIVEAQEGLTLPVMQKLDAEVEIEGKDPEAVARDYLKSVDYTG